MLVRPLAGEPPAPETVPIGRAALHLAAEGVDVVFGTAEGAQRPVAGGWRATEVAPIAVHDRYPSWSYPRAFERARAGLRDLPWGNPLSFRDHCRDKVAFQRGTQVAMPELVEDPTQFDAAVREWGSGFLKPRFGGLGRGVRFVRPGDPLPARLEGAVPGELEPSILQRAVPPPDGLAGLSTRWLLQRDVTGAWICAGAVCRVSRTDPVANVDRGAEVLPETALEPRTRDAARSLVAAVCEELRDPQVCEVGLDLVIDPDGVPHLIEANSRPGGRLRALGPAWDDAHVQACARPLRYLCQLGPAWPVG